MAIVDPFSSLSDEGLDRREDSPHYGRYRLCFDQVHPFSPFETRVRVRAGRERDAFCLHALLPDHVRGLFELKRQQERPAGGECIHDFDGDDTVLSIEQVPGVRYLAIENVYCAVRSFAELVDDVHFFVYSSGDDDTRWLDEYRIRAGKMLFERHMSEDEIYLGRYYAWLQLTPRRREEPGWETFLVTGIAEICQRIINPARKDLLRQLACLCPGNHRVRELNALGSNSGDAQDE